MGRSLATLFLRRQIEIHSVSTFLRDSVVHSAIPILLGNFPPKSYARIIVRRFLFGVFDDSNPGIAGNSPQLALGLEFKFELTIFIR